MGFIELIIIGVSLAMDAFAVSICKGLSMRTINYLYAFLIALVFGLFQAIMPLIGWFLGSSFSAYVEPVDHWIAFILLAAIGAKMIWDGVHDDDSDDLCDCSEASTYAPFKLDIKELLLLGIATSIDALAVGISFSFLDVNIIQAVIIIGVVTFLISFVGVTLGNAFGKRFQSRATIFGGVVLILIGLKILIEHLFF